MAVGRREGVPDGARELRKRRRGDGKKEDLKVLKEISQTMMLSSLCGVGQAAPNSVVDTLDHFTKEYEDSIAG